jgi:CHAD domain-containing protein
MKATRKFVRDRFKKVRKQLKLFRKTSQPEALHHFRVEIKKLRAFYLLLGFCDPHFDSEKKFKPLRKIFHQLGLIRDVDVMQQLLKKYKIRLDKTITVLDRKNQKQNIKHFCSDIPSFLESVSKAEKKLCHHIKVIHRECLHEYLLKKEKEIKKQLGNRSFDKCLHESRKAIKQVIYLSRIEGGLTPRVFSYYNTLQTDIGGWHDKQILHKFIKDLSFENKKIILKKLALKIKKIRLL